MLSYFGAWLNLATGTQEPGYPLLCSYPGSKIVPEYRRCGRNVCMPVAALQCNGEHSKLSRGRNARPARIPRLCYTVPDQMSATDVLPRMETARLAHSHRLNCSHWQWHSSTSPLHSARSHIPPAGVGMLNDTPRTRVPVQKFGRVPGQLFFNNIDSPRHGKLGLTGRKEKK